MTETKARSYLMWFWLLACLGLVIDQWSKYAIFATLYHDGNGGAIILVPETFILEARYTTEMISEDEPFYSLLAISGKHWPFVNQGALFGIGTGNNFVFAVVSFLAAGVVIYWSHRATGRHDRLLCCSLGLILAGTLGNCYDRCLFHGVRDFFHWFRWYDWPVFNVADVCLVTGASLLVLHAFLVGDAKPASTETSVTSVSTTADSATTVGA